MRLGSAMHPKRQGATHRVGFMNEKDTFCSYCGRRFEVGAAWPKVCLGCGNTTFLNPTPVAVVLQPVGAQLLVVRRNIEPGLGKLALPGGFIELGESWQTAAARELYEETNINIHPAKIRIFDVLSAEEDNVILIFGLAPPLSESEMPPFDPTSEVTELVLLSNTAEMAFPLHQQIVTAFFSSFGHS